MLSEHNQELLALIAREHPGSLTELARLAGREKSNLSRTLKTLARYGLVELETGLRGRLIPRVLYDRVQLDFRYDRCRPVPRDLPPRRPGEDSPSCGDSASSPRREFYTMVPKSHLTLLSTER